VTRLGEFSPIELFLYLGNLITKLYKYSKFLVLFNFEVKFYVIKFVKIWLGLHFGRFLATLGVTVHSASMSNVEGSNRITYVRENGLDKLHK
jgi:hypothetical protein